MARLGNAFALLALATETYAGPNRKKGRHKNQCLHRLDCWLVILCVLGMKPRLLDGARRRDSPVDPRRCHRPRGGLLRLLRLREKYKTGQGDRAINARRDGDAHDVGS